MHVDLDRVAAHLVAETEQLVDHLLLAHHASLARKQELGQREFARRQVDGNVVVEKPPRDGIEAQPAMRHLAAGVDLRALIRRAHAGLEFGQVERLGHVVVGAQVEPLDALVERVARGEDQYRDVRAPVAQPAQHAQAVDLGQRDVEHDDIVTVDGQRLVRGVAVGGVVDGVAALVERAHERRRQHAVVLDHQHLQFAPPPSLSGRRRSGCAARTGARVPSSRICGGNSPAGMRAGNHGCRRGPARTPAPISRKTRRPPARRLRTSAVAALRTLQAGKGKRMQARLSSVSSGCPSSGVGPRSSHNSCGAATRCARGDPRSARTTMLAPVDAISQGGGAGWIAMSAICRALRTMSSRMNTPVSAAESPRHVSPASLSRSAKLASASIAVTAAATRARAAAGRCAGATMPTHISNSRPGHISPNAGTSGSAESRVGDVTASTRNWRALAATRADGSASTSASMPPLANAAYSCDTTSTGTWTRFAC